MAEMTKRQYQTHFDGDDALPYTTPNWLAGLHHVRNQPYTRLSVNYPIVWQCKQSRCYYVKGTAPHNAPPLLFIPSLINRYYILDLNQTLSLVQNLARTHHVYILDWTEPRNEQSHEASQEYVTHYLCPLVTYLNQRRQQPVALAGYCIGGLLALATSILCTDAVNKLILLATPWDFHASQRQRYYYAMLTNCNMQRYCSSQPLLPGAVMSWLFYLSNPGKCAKKYQEFLQLDPSSEAYQHFIEVEHWVHDTTPLTRAFAKECLCDWAGQNQLAHGQWHIGKQPINPTLLNIPVFIAAPQDDDIVPYESAMALAPLIKDSTVITPKTGHIGMVIGSKRRENLWDPLTAWLLST